MKAMDKTEGSPVITSRPASRSWFPKLAIAFFAVIFLVLGIEGYYWYRLTHKVDTFESVTGEDRDVVTDQYQAVESDSLKKKLVGNRYPAKLLEVQVPRFHFEAMIDSEWVDINKEFSGIVWNTKSGSRGQGGLRLEDLVGRDDLEITLAKNDILMIYY